MTRDINDVDNTLPKKMKSTSEAHLRDKKPYEKRQHQTEPIPQNCMNHFLQKFINKKLHRSM